MLIRQLAPLWGIACCLLWATPALAQVGAPVRLATHDQAPYGSYQSDKTFDGIAVRVVQCVFKRMGRPVAIEVFPWERAQMLAERGDVDGFFPATIKPERLVWAQSTGVVADQKWVWYLPVASTLDPLSAEFKAQARVGAHFGSNRLKLLEEKQYNVSLKPQTDEQLLLAFIKGRADAILGGDLSIAKAMKDNHINPKDFRTVVALDAPLHVYFGRKFLTTEPTLLKQFDSHIAACR